MIMEMGASPRWMQLERAALRRAASLPGRPCPTQLSGAGGAGWQLQDMGSKPGRWVTILFLALHLSAWELWAWEQAVCSGGDALEPACLPAHS